MSEASMFMSSRIRMKTSIQLSMHFSSVLEVADVRRSMLSVGHSAREDIISLFQMIDSVISDPILYHY